MIDKIDFTQVRPTESRLRTLFKAYSHKPKNKFGDPEYVFLHVGKTGGTSINAFFHSCHKAGLRVPIVLNHNWSYRMARARFPKSKMIVVLRDPLERIIPGFNSRLREGRPLGHPWRTDEAIAFSHFKSAESFVSALSSNSDYDVSAARFCFRSINHLRRGYSYQFEGLENASKALDAHLHACNIEDIGVSIPKIIENMNKKQLINNSNLKNLHKSPIKSSTILDKLYKSKINIIKERLFLEYNSYNYLKSYILNS